VGEGLEGAGAKKQKEEGRWARVDGGGAASPVVTSRCPRAVVNISAGRCVELTGLPCNSYVCQVRRPAGALDRLIIDR